MGCWQRGEKVLDPHYRYQRIDEGRVLKGKEGDRAIDKKGCWSLLFTD